MFCEKTKIQKQISNNTSRYCNSSSVKYTGTAGAVLDTLKWSGKFGVGYTTPHLINKVMKPMFIVHFYLKKSFAICNG